MIELLTPQCFKLKNENHVRCFGDNSYGQLGIGSNIQNSSEYSENSSRDLLEYPPVRLFKDMF